MRLRRQTKGEKTFFPLFVKVSLVGFFSFGSNIINKVSGCFCGWVDQEQKRRHHESFFRLLRQWKITSWTPSAFCRHRGATSSANKLFLQANTGNNHSHRNNLEGLWRLGKFLSESVTSPVDGYSTEGPLASLRHREPAELWGMCARKHQSQQRAAGLMRH